MKKPSRIPSIRVCLVMLGMIGVALAACSGTQSGALTNPGAGTPEVLTLAGRGPSVYLANGSGVTILSPALGRNVLANVTYDPRAVVAAPDSWSIVPGTLLVRFSPALRSGGANEAGVRLTLGYPHDRAAAVRAGWALRVIADYAGGKQLGWVAFGQLDDRRDRVTTELPASLLNGAVSVTLALGTDNIHYLLETPGPRYWTGTAWNKDGKIESGKRTVVLIHGIFSSVESSFPTVRPSSTTTPCAQRIANAGHFEQVLGFDYKWNEPPLVEGSLFAGFLRSIAAAGISSVTIEAHSYGSVVTLAAVPMVEKQLKVDHAVTLGGPLPTRGTPLALPDNHWRMGFIMGFLDWFFNEPPDVVDRAFKSGMIASLATDSANLRKIALSINQMASPPHFVEVAGTNWIFGEKTFERQLIEGSGVKLPWDGVVETLAAESTSLPSPTPKEFELSHIELECDNSVINWVGDQVKPR